MRVLTKNILARLLILLLSMSVAFAEDEIPSAKPAFKQAELDQVLAPIALYPDSLLSQILMASTYPLEVVEAARWSRANPSLKGYQAVKAVEQKDWDPTVKSLVAFPQVLTMMDEKLDCTEKLGEVFLAQQAQVMDTVQGLRQKVQVAGNLNSSEQIRVTQQPGQPIVVQPAYPEVVYVPYYDPNVIYGPWWWPAYPPVYWAPWPGYYVGPAFVPGFVWGSGVFVYEAFFFSVCDWRHHTVNIVTINNVNRNTVIVNQAAPFVWHHDPIHSKGVVFHEKVLQQSRFGSTVNDARRNFRGTDQSWPEQRSGPHSQPQPSTANSPRSIPNSWSRPELRSVPNGRFVGNGGSPQVHGGSIIGGPPAIHDAAGSPRAVPRAVSRPVVAMRESTPNTFVGVSRGPDVGSIRSRGHMSNKNLHNSGGMPHN